MIIAREAWKDGAAQLTAAGIESARLDARVLLAHAMGVSSDSLFSQRIVAAGEEAAFRKLLNRRMAREPVAYLTGMREFWSLSFEVGPGVLIPRPETETLLEEAQRHFANRDAPRAVLDLGTGSGCLLIAALHLFPHALGSGIDRSQKALAWAQKNAARLGVVARSSWHAGDWSSVTDRYDLVLANPPYLRQSDLVGLAPEISRHEPTDALFAGEDGLDAYRALIPLLGRVLAPDGRAFLEIGQNQADSVRSVVEAAGLEFLGLAPDLAGVPRCMAVGIASTDSGVNSRAEAEKTVGNLRSSR